MRSDSVKSIAKLDVIQLEEKIAPAQFLQVINGEVITNMEGSQVGANQYQYSSPGIGSINIVTDGGLESTYGSSSGGASHSSVSVSSRPGLESTYGSSTSASVAPPPPAVEVTIVNPPDAEPVTVTTNSPGNIAVDNGNIYMWGPQLDPSDNPWAGYYQPGDYAGYPFNNGSIDFYNSMQSAANSVQESVDDIIGWASTYSSGNNFPFDVNTFVNDVIESTTSPWLSNGMIVEPSTVSSSNYLGFFNPFGMNLSYSVDSSYNIYQNTDFSDLFM